MTIDIWLFAAACLFILACCAALRVRPGPPLQDRLLAANVAATLGCAGALSLTVSAGDLILSVLALIIVGIVFATTIRISEGNAGEVP